MLNERAASLRLRTLDIGAIIAKFGRWSNMALYTGNVRLTKSCGLISTRVLVGPASGCIHDNVAGSQSNRTK